MFWILDISTLDVLSQLSIETASMQCVSLSLSLSQTITAWCLFMSLSLSLLSPLSFPHSFPSKDILLPATAPLKLETAPRTRVSLSQTLLLRDVSLCLHLSLPLTTLSFPSSAIHKAVPFSRALIFILFFVFIFLFIPICLSPSSHLICVSTPITVTNNRRTSLEFGTLRLLL